MMKNNRFRLILFLIGAIPNTLLFNFRTFEFRRAIKLPVIIGHNVKIYETHKNCIAISSNIKKITGLLIIGWGGTRSVIENHRGAIVIHKSGTITLNGKTRMAAGSSLDVSGNLIIGKNFSTNKNCFLSCSRNVVIGDDVMLGWNVKIFDASGHKIFYDGKPNMDQEDINIGDHVWLCSESQLLKGAEIGNDSVVGWGSIVTKKLNDNNCLIAGAPAQIKKKNVTWTHLTEDI